jgi:hypothetical protein
MNNAAPTLTNPVVEPVPADTALRSISVAEMASRISVGRNTPPEPPVADPQPTTVDPVIDPPSPPQINEPAGADPEPQPAPSEPPPAEIHPELAGAIQDAKAGGSAAVAALLKRVNKLTAQNYALRAQQVEPPAPAPAPATSQPTPTPQTTPTATADWSGDAVVGQAEQAIKAAADDLSFADANPTGGTFTTADNRQVEVSAQQIAVLKRQALSQLATMTARAEMRRAQLAAAAETAQAASVRVALELVPGLSNPASVESGIARQVLAQNPTLMQSPNAAELVADLVAMQMQRRTKKSPAAPERVRPAPVTPGLPVTGAPAIDLRASERAAYEAVKAGGSERDFANLLRIKRATPVA